MISGKENWSTEQSLPMTPAMPSQLINVMHPEEFGDCRLDSRAETSSEFSGKSSDVYDSLPKL
jgi:hypothetical protein